jgi:hypothetical protein
MKNTALTVLIIFFLLYQKIGYSQQAATVTVLNGGYFQIEYGCITQLGTFEINFPAFKVTDLEYEWTYYIDTWEDTLPIIRAVDYAPFPDYFVKINTTHWMWNHPTITTDTIVLELSGNYSDWEIGASQWFTFIVDSPSPYGWSSKNVNISIIPPDPAIEITGASLSCSNPVSFNLINLPTSYTTATWEIKQGTSTRASGSGTTASANNISNGAGEVIFTLHFNCGLSDLTYKKDFWFGVPSAPITYPVSPIYESINSVFYVSITDSPGADPSTGTWELYGCVSPDGTPSGPIAEFFSCNDNGCGTIYVSTSNGCGTLYRTALTVITGSGGDCGDLPERIEPPTLKISPNPANDFVEINIDTKSQKKSNEFKVEIYDVYFKLVKSFAIYNSTEKLSVSDLPKGNYVIFVHNRDFQIQGKLIIQR